LGARKTKVSKKIANKSHRKPNGNQEWTMQKQNTES